MLSRTAWPNYARRLQFRGPTSSWRYAARFASEGGSPPKYEESGDGEHAPSQADRSEEQAKGAMTQRLEQMSEDALTTGGRSARKAVEETGSPGFSEDLRRELEDKIAAAKFRSGHAAAISQVDLPESAPKHARELAASPSWKGSGSAEDANLRMLNDTHRPAPRGPPWKVDSGRSRSRPSAGTRLASAREKVINYASEDAKGLTDEERERFRQEVKARFQPGARHVVASVQGVISLANQRIEDAIARGQFKNLPRGQKIERDHNASSPFIDTTTYLMNKMIKKQDIVPQWIEKQQEVITTANIFRRRLRSDWKRHVSRMITSRGGSVESHVRLAEEYAFAESLENPSKEQIEKMNTMDSQGHQSQVTVSGQLKPETTDDATRMDEEIKVLEQSFNDDGSLKSPEQQVKVSTEHTLLSQAAPDAPRTPTVVPFRDEAWEKIELSYHTLAVKELNELTRSYNLMAPNLAKKPYFSLERELKSCFADVAPQVAAAIRDRALAPKSKDVEVIGHKPGSVLEKFAMDNAGHVHDERKPQYGFKEFWRDLFAPKT